jgi:hypothetical protein
VITVICEECGGEFKVYPYKLKIGRGKFCSTACFYKSKIGKPLSERHRANISASQIGKNNHNFGKHPSEEARAKMRANHADVKGEKHPMFGKPPTHGIGRIYESIRNGPLWTRSSYERRFITVSDDLCYSFDWEPKAFELEINGKKTTYRPDVFVRDLNLWIEIKGYWRDGAKEKFEAFKNRYLEERIVVMTIDELKRFENDESLDVIYKGDEKEW